MLGPLLGSEVMGAERMMKRRVKRGKSAQLQVPGPGQRMMGEEWWMEGGLTGPEEGGRWVKLGWLEERWRVEGRCLQPELVGRGAAALRQDRLRSPPHPAGSAGGRKQGGAWEGEARVRSRWVERGRWTVMGMEVQERAQVLMKNLKIMVGKKEMK